MKKYLMIAVAMGALMTSVLMAPSTGEAQNNRGRHWNSMENSAGNKTGNSMSAEEREKALAARKNHWHNLSDEEKDTIRARHKARNQKQRDNNSKVGKYTPETDETNRHGAKKRVGRFDAWRNRFKIEMPPAPTRRRGLNE